ncbi:MAG: SelB C-terminal domain-containing protein [Pseudonocardia sp.]
MRTHVVATAGHVDHGKSTLVRALTGMEPDRYAEERRRGMTLDLGFVWMRLGGPDEPRSIAFVDVPGHERFVATMLAGVGPVPAVLLAVAADEGWMPQSAEHLDALDALGVTRGLLAVTRTDLADPAPAIAEARTQLATSTLRGIPAVAVSARTGAGLPTLRTALHTLVDGLPDPDDGAPVRFWADRAFTVRGAGTVVTGTLAAGAVAVGERLRVAGRTAVVRGLQSLGRPVERARGVARVGLNLRGVPADAVARGEPLLTPGAWLDVTELDGRLHAVRGRTVDPAELPRELRLHIGSAVVAARVRPLGADVVRVRLARPLPLRIGDRAVLRDPGAHRIVGGLIVLDVRPPMLRRRGAAARRAADLGAVRGRPDAADELARRGTVRESALVAMGVPAAAVATLAAVRGGGWLLDPTRVRPLHHAARAAVAAHDAADPVDPGLAVEALRRALDLPHPDLVRALLASGPVARADPTDEPTDDRTDDRTDNRTDNRTGRLPASGLAVRDGRVHLDRRADLPPPLHTALTALRADLARAPFAAPDAARLAELGLGPRELARLVRAGELLAVADGIVLLPGADGQAVAVLAGLGPVFTVSQARRALATTRRVAVPLLELLARRGRTVRTADGGHRLAPEP